MEARIMFPSGNVNGNLLWNKLDAISNQESIKQSLLKLQAMSYWVSRFPEGDGVTFSHKGARSDDEIMGHFTDAFDWLTISKATKSGNLELADLEPDREILCTVIVPLYKLKIETTFQLAQYQFVCARDFDAAPHSRLGDFEGEYLEFKASLLYQDLLKVNSSYGHNNVVINKCLALAENAMDIIRYQFSTFLKPEFTPNPAGQQADGFYAIEIIPEERTHLKPISLTGISKPISFSNNWLGPEVEYCIAQGVSYLADVLNGRNDELALSVKSALRSCRQSFYALGDESRFLNLVFTLDGLAAPDKKWAGWKHRTYIAALVSDGDLYKFKRVLKNYDQLYSDVRNKLVHGGADFYELPSNPAQASEDIFLYIKDLIGLIELSDFKKSADLQNYAIMLLNDPNFVVAYNLVISEVSTTTGRASQNCSWVNELQKLTDGQT
jgi:hypothetical protein